VVFEKEYIMRWSPLFYSFWKVECLEMMPSWCRQVNWGNCGISWVNCPVLCVKDDGRGQFWDLRYCMSELRSLLSFPLGMTSHCKIAQFNLECIVPYNLSETRICVCHVVRAVSWHNSQKKVEFVHRCVKRHRTRQDVRKQVLTKRCFLILPWFPDEGGGKGCLMSS
jgi:hypothetical protein